MVTNLYLKPSIVGGTYDVFDGAGTRLAVGLSLRQIAERVEFFGIVAERG